MDYRFALLICILALWPAWGQAQPLRDTGSGDPGMFMSQNAQNFDENEENEDVPIVDVLDGGPLFVPAATPDDVVDDAPVLPHAVQPEAPDSDEYAAPDDEESGEPRLPNPVYTVERISIVGNAQTSRERILDIMHVVESDRRTMEQLEEIRIRLVLCGLFETVDVQLKPGRDRSSLAIELSVEERAPLQINQYYIGTDDKSPFWLGLDVTWLAPFGTSHRLRMNYAATSSNDYTLSLYYLIPTINQIPISLMLGIHSMQSHEGIFGTPSSNDLLSTSGVHLGEMAFERHGASVGLGYSPVSKFRMLLRVGYMRLWRQNAASTYAVYLDDFMDSGHSNLLNAALIFSYDTRPGHELPNSGHLMHFTVAGTAETKASDYEYLRFSLMHQSNIPLGKKAHILRVNSFFGAVVGDAPFFEKFFFNDLYTLAPSRIGKLNPSERGAFDIFDTGAGTLGYEDYIAHLALSYAWQPVTRRFELFALVGATWANSKDTSRVTLGIRPEGERGRFPVDMSFNAGVRVKTSYGLFSLTLGHIFNLIPR